MPRNFVLRPYPIARPPALEAAPSVRIPSVSRRAASVHAVLGKHASSRVPKPAASSAQAQDKLATSPYDGWTPAKVLGMAGVFVCGAVFGVMFVFATVLG